MIFQNKIQPAIIEIRKNEPNSKEETTIKAPFIYSFIGERNSEFSNKGTVKVKV